MRAFFAIVLLLLTATTAFTAWTFARFEGVPVLPVLGVALVLVLPFLPTTILSRQMQAPWLRALNVLSAVAVGFMSFFLIAALASWVAFAGLGAAGYPMNPSAIANVAFGLAAGVAALALGSAFWLRLTHVTVHLAGLPAFWKGRTLALVSDIHLGNVRGERFSRRLVARLARLGAECILIGGDVFDGVKTDIAGALGPWAGLTAPSGVFFVGGNHDDYGGRLDYFAALQAVGLRELANTKVELHGLQLVGVHDEETHAEATYRQILAGARLDPARPSILLAHRPENLAVPESAGISLQLSGHTHGGQFWPWTHIVRRVHGDFARGLGQFGRMLVYTSTGAGTWGPPFRLGTRAEIVLIKLEPA